MRRVSVLGLAIVLTLGLGMAATQAKPKKRKVKSEISFAIEDLGPTVSDGVRASGRVTSRKPNCVRNRRVKIVRLDESEFRFAGADQTDSAGNYEVPDTFAYPGTWRATATQKIFRNKRGKKVFCVVAHSAVIEVKG